MNTTAIIAEHVVSGLLFVLWITLLLFKIDCDLYWTMVVYLPTGSAWIPASFFALGLLYALGVIGDRISDVIVGSLLGWLKDSRLIGLKAFGGLSPSDRTRIALLIEEENLGSFVDYLRTIARVSRTVVFNLFALVLIMSFHSTEYYILYTGSVLWVLSALAWATIAREYDETLNHYICSITKRNLAKANDIAGGLPQIPSENNP
jgi:hypothetical protein